MNILETVACIVVVSHDNLLDVALTELFGLSSG
jgi:hypothetical protein